MTDQELIGYLDRRFGELSQKVDEKIEGLREENRQTRVVLEEKIQQTWEESRQAREESQRAREESQQAREENRQTRVVLEGIRSEIQLLAEGVIGQGETFAARQSETLKAIEEVKALVTPAYQDLNRRVKILEERAERQTRDVVDVILERFGKR